MFNPEDSQWCAGLRRICAQIVNGALRLAKVDKIHIYSNHSTQHRVIGVRLGFTYAPVEILRAVKRMGTKTA